MSKYADVSGDKGEYEGKYKFTGQFIHESGEAYPPFIPGQADF